MNELQVYLFVHHLATENPEGVQVNAFVEREDGVTDGGVVGQTEVFLRGARGRGGMTVPVGENLQPFAAGIAQGGKLVFRREGEVLGRVVRVLHPVVFGHDVAVRTAGAQQVTARLVGCVLPGLAD